MGEVEDEELDNLRRKLLVMKSDRFGSITCHPIGIGKVEVLGNLFEFVKVVKI